MSIKGIMIIHVNKTFIHWKKSTTIPDQKYTKFKVLFLIFVIFLKWFLFLIIQQIFLWIQLIFPLFKIVYHYFLMKSFLNYILNFTATKLQIIYNKNFWKKRKFKQKFASVVLFIFKENRLLINKSPKVEKITQFVIVLIASLPNDFFFFLNLRNLC